LDNIYCIDTSSLIDLKKFPQDIFPSLWQSIERLANEKRLIAPIEVKKEIEKKDDELKQWVKRNNIFILQDKNQANTVKKYCKITRNLQKQIVLASKMLILGW